MYSYKVIDNSSIKKKKGFFAPRELGADTKVDDAIKTLKSKDNSCFVKVNNDFFKVIEGNVLSKGNYNQERESIAIINGYDRTDIKVKTFYANSHSVSDIKRVPLCFMERFTIDCTSKSSREHLENMGIVNSKINGVLANEECIYVYNKIDGDNVLAELSPLFQDVLYALVKEHGFTENNICGFIKYIMPSISLSNDFGFTASEKVLFEAMYVDNKNLTTVLNEILEQNKINVDMIRLEDESFVTVPDTSKDLMLVNNDYGFDPLNIYSYLVNRKRSIIAKILKSIDMELKTICIAEDELKVSRMFDALQDNDVNLSYNGENLIIPPQQFDSRYFRTQFYTLSKIADFNKYNDLLEVNKDALDKSYLLEQMLIKSLKRTPNY